MGRSCSTHGREAECVYEFDGKAGRKESITKTYRRLEDNIKMDLINKMRC
jgi:hypothetical protein